MLASSSTSVKCPSLLSVMISTMTKSDLQRKELVSADMLQSITEGSWARNSTWDLAAGAETAEEDCFLAHRQTHIQLLFLHSSGHLFEMVLPAVGWTLRY